MIDNQAIKIKSGKPPGPDQSQLANAIFEYIEGFHNRTRLHSALGWKTPQEFEQHHQHQATGSAPT